MNNCRPEKQHELFIKLKMIYDQFVKKNLNLKLTKAQHISGIVKRRFRSKKIIKGLVKVAINFWFLFQKYYDILNLHFFHIMRLIRMLFQIIVKFEMSTQCVVPLNWVTLKVIKCLEKSKICVKNGKTLSLWLSSLKNRDFINHAPKGDFLFHRQSVNQRASSQKCFGRSCFRSISQKSFRGRKLWIKISSGIFRDVSVTNFSINQKYFLISHWRVK